ncbi:hypothetical protein EV385_5173 [Krasilnikovia cinnamomea]|uniref:Uncharacterized protein n=1 Tax=Krasilnikovia cinnamomea TaxID=349313 RepID=A0A4Q7ZRY3_9ACTN|nr:hypothetical protein [Krasilnikovia cinnamomea]RZU53265.1 hypothetical protein EV385_5173 [Krasilnikovia cinnamomea]
MLPAVTMGEPVVMQVYCRVEVVVDDQAAVAELAVQRLGDAEIDWSREQDTVEDAVAELRTDLVQALASVVDPERMLDGVPGVQVRRGRWWAERGEPSARFQPGFTPPGS